jgi:WD40 repeat protein
MSASEARPDDDPERAHGTKAIPGFRRSVAIFISIDDYSNGVPTLRTPTEDARALAGVLRDQHGFDVRLLLDTDASLEGVRTILRDLPFELSGEDRVFLYFAGHGLALDGDDGPQGYLLPSDAKRDTISSFLPMNELYEALKRLPCRHLLAILDCCFAGAFRWFSTRHMELATEHLHLERFNWFVSGRAWQAIASAAHDQKAIDVFDGEPLGARGAAGRHSPFAAALIEGLMGDADRPGREAPPDGVITATELFLYLEERLAPAGDSRRNRQTPVFWPLGNHERGEFVFLRPGCELALTPAPPLDINANPWLGLRTYTDKEADRFFGRRDITERLIADFQAKPLVVVTGPSGIGKSSLILAGLLPRLSADYVSVVLRPGPAPFVALADAVGSERNKAEMLESDLDGLIQLIELRQDPRRLVLVVDQAEELVTQPNSKASRNHFLSLLSRALEQLPERLKVVLSVRSDLEPQLVDTADTELQTLWSRGRFFVPPMRREELRRVVEGPAAVKVMRFESQDLVDRVVDDVLQMPGALPLLSFALSEMYLCYLKRAPGDRTLALADLEALGGGVTGSLQVRANALIAELAPASQVTARRVLERLVSIEGGEFARRRVREHDFETVDAIETGRAKDVLRSLADGRLVVTDNIDGEPHVELAHDALIIGWGMFYDWLRTDAPRIADQRRLAQDASAFERAPSENAGLLWDDAARIDTILRLESAPAPGLNRAEKMFADASQRRARRNQRLMVGAIGLLIALTVGALTAATLAFRAQREAERRTLEARSEQLASEAQLRTIGQQRGTPEEGLLLAAESLRLNPTVAGYAAFEDALNHLPMVLSSVNVGVGARMVRYIADQKTLLAVDGDRTAHIRNLDGTELRKFALEERVTDAAYDAGRHALALAGATGVVEWDVLSGGVTWQAKFSSPVIAVNYPKEGGKLAIACADDSIIVHDVGGSEPVPIAPQGSGFSAFAFSDDGTKLAYGAGPPPPEAERGAEIPPALQGMLASLRPRKSKLVIVGTADGKPLREVDLQALPTVVTFDRSGGRVAIGQDEGTVLVVRLSDGAVLQTFRLLRRKVIAVDFLDDDRLVSTASSGTVVLWSMNSTVPLMTLPHQGIVTSLHVDHKRHRLLTIAADGAAYGWEPAVASSAASTRPDVSVFRYRAAGIQSAWFDADSGYAVLLDRQGMARLVSYDHPSMVTQIHFSLNGLNNVVAVGPGGHRVAVASNLMNALVRWPSGEEEKSWVSRSEPGGLPPITLAMEFSPDGKRLFAAEGAHIAIRDAADPKSVRTLPETASPVGWISLSLADHGESIVASTQNAIAGWRLGPGETQLSFMKSLESVAAVVGDPNGKQMFVAAQRVEARTTDTGELLWERDVGARPFALALSHQGDMLAVGTSDGQILLLKAPRWEVFARYQVHEDAIGTIDLSTDGHYLLSTSGLLQTAMIARRDQSLQVTDLRNGAQILRLPTRGAPAAAHFMPDGTLAILDEGRLKRFDWRPDALHSRACAAVGSDLPDDVLNSLHLQPVCRSERLGTGSQ